jgi:hypothetical protein
MGSSTVLIFLVWRTTAIVISPPNKSGKRNHVCRRVHAVGILLLSFVPFFFCARMLLLLLLLLLDYATLGVVVETVVFSLLWFGRSVGRSLGATVYGVCTGFAFSLSPFLPFLHLALFFLHMDCFNKTTPHPHLLRLQMLAGPSLCLQGRRSCWVACLRLSLPDDYPTQTPLTIIHSIKLYIHPSFKTYIHSYTQSRTETSFPLDKLVFSFFGLVFCFTQTH